MEKMINDIIEWRTKLYFISDFILLKNRNPEFVRFRIRQIIQENTALQTLIPTEAIV